MKTLVIGASKNPERYSFKAINMLREYDHEVVAVGLKIATVGDVEIQTGQPDFRNIDTVTLYINPKRQPDFYTYIIGLKPRRVIFNPGTENTDLYTLLEQNEIRFEEACTLVLLRTNQF
jgi:predicted CoA-binding protein